MPVNEEEIQKISTPNAEITQDDVEEFMIINLRRFGYLNTRKDRAEFTAVINSVLNQPEFKMPLPMDPEDPTKVKPYTEPPTEQMVDEYRRNKNKIETNEGEAMLKKYEEDQ